MKNRLFRYFIICIAIFLALSVIEIFILRPLFEMITTHFFGILIIYSLLMLVINPLITRYLADRFDPKRQLDKQSDL